MQWGVCLFVEGLVGFRHVRSQCFCVPAWLCCSVLRGSSGPPPCSPPPPAVERVQRDSTVLQELLRVSSVQGARTGRRAG
jgi:hypothetical protein